MKHAETLGQETGTYVDCYCDTSYVQITASPANPVCACVLVVTRLTHSSLSRFSDRLAMSSVISQQPTSARNCPSTAMPSFLDPKALTRFGSVDYG